MSQQVAIVTDSTASVPVEIAEQLGIATVQLELKVGDEYNDERRVPQPELAHAMRSGVPVATEPPPPPAFFWNYTDAIAAGAQTIVSVHISEALSKTCESARTAAAEMNVPVYVVDSKLTGFALGYSVMAAAEAARAGANPQVVLSVLDRRLRTATQLLYVDTLEYLRAGGRIGRVQATVAQTLSIKPVLILQNGALDSLAKGFGLDRALSKAVTAAVKRAGTGKVDVGIEHFEAADRANKVAEELQKRVNVNRLLVGETSAIIGAHTGPGAIGVTVSPV